MKFKLYNVEICPTKEYAAKLAILGFETIERQDCGLRIKHSNDLTIEINTLEDLVKFTKEYGSIVLDGDELTIYDDYME